MKLSAAATPKAYKFYEFACHSAACRPPGKNGGTGGSSKGGSQGGSATSGAFNGKNRSNALAGPRGASGASTTHENIKRNRDQFRAAGNLTAKETQASRTGKTQAGGHATTQTVAARPPDTHDHAKHPMRIVRTKSIPNISTERLEDNLRRIHDLTHTKEGIYAHDDTRRALINRGVKGKQISQELMKRGGKRPACKFCAPNEFPTDPAPRLGPEKRYGNDPVWKT